MDAAFDSLPLPAIEWICLRIQVFYSDIGYRLVGDITTHSQLIRRGAPSLLAFVTIDRGVPEEIQKIVPLPSLARSPFCVSCGGHGTNGIGRLPNATERRHRRQRTFIGQKYAPSSIRGSRGPSAFFAHEQQHIHVVAFRQPTRTTAACRCQAKFGSSCVTYE